MSPQKPSQSRKTSRASQARKTTRSKIKEPKSQDVEETLLKDAADLTLREALKLAQESGASWTVSGRGKIRFQPPREPVSKTNKAHFRIYQSLSAIARSRDAIELMLQIMDPLRIKPESNEVNLRPSEMGPALQELILANLLQHKTGHRYIVNPRVAFNGKEATREKMLGRWGNIGEADCLAQRIWVGVEEGATSASIQFEADDK